MEGNGQDQHLQHIRKAYRIRTRQTPFIEGIYRIKHPLLLLVRPKIRFAYNKKRTKAKARLAFLGHDIPLIAIKNKGIQLVYAFNIESIPIDLVIRFYKRDAFEGFFDTPIGQFKVSGVYVKSLYEERSLWEKKKR